tara:strand:- start:20 stop:4807 length:4788 start_codon:yes stop_codon:yes gene_type:complete
MDNEASLDTPVSISRASGENVANYVVTPASAADSNYSVSFVTSTFAITQAALTVTANSGLSKVYGATDPTLTYTITGFQGMDNEASLDTPVSISRAAGENVANYVVTPSGASDSNYSISFVTSTFAITQAALTVTADSGLSKVYGSTDPTFTYTITGFQGADNEASLDTPVSISRASGENVANYVVTPASAADTNYSISFVTNTFGITPAPLTVTAQQQSKIYGNSLTLDSTGFLITGFVNGDTAPSLSFNNATITSSTGVDVSTTAIVGTYSNEIIISGLSNPNYDITFVPGDLIVNQRNITVTADPGQNKVSGASDPIFAYSITFGSLVGSDSFTGLLSRVSGELVGPYAITLGTLSAGSNYNVSFVPNDFTIQLVITAGFISRSSKSVTVTGLVSSDPAITERGVVYSSTDTTPELGEPGVIKVIDDTTTGPFIVEITGLSPNTTYYYQLYIITPTSRSIVPLTFYGGVQNFITLTSEPEATAFSPLDNATLVDPAGDLTITFDIPVQKESGIIEIRNSSDDSVLESIDVSSMNVTVTNNVVTINPTSDLPQLSDVYVHIPLATFSDGSLNSWSGVVDKTVWNFQTDDTVAPTVTGVTPVDDSTDVAPKTDLTVTFDENMTKGTGNILVKNSSDDSLIATLDVASSEVSITGNVVTINPDTDLPGGTSLYIEVPSGVFEDQYDNAYAGISGNSTWNFTTQVIAATFNSTSSDGLESVSSVTIPLSLSVPISVAATVDYTVTGTATAGSDYTLANGTLTFTAGSTSQSITIASIIDDLMLESNETVIVTLSNPVNTTLGSTTVYTHTITNNDAAAVTIGDVLQNEDNGAITVTATLDNPVQGGFTVDLSTADGTATTADNDYTAVTSQTLTFAGTAGETQIFSILPTTDLKVETDETLTVSQSNVSATSLSADIDITDGATLTIGNDDSTSVTIEDVTVIEADGVANVIATLSNPVQGGFVLNITTADGTAVTTNDYTSFADVAGATFTGTAGETQTIAIPITDDTVGEEIESFTVSLSSLNGTSLSTNIDIADTATITITDDDAPVVTMVSVPADGNYGIGDNLDLTVTFTNPATITGAPSIPVTIGSTTVQAVVNGSFTNSLTADFRYTIVEGNEDLDGITVGTDIVLNGGTIVGSTDIDAILTLNNVASTANVDVDGIKPTVVITTDASDPTNVPFTATFTFSEDVTGFDLTDITVSNGTASDFTAVSTTVYTALITPTADGTVNVDVAQDVAQDVVGNNNTAAVQYSVLYDATNPTAVMSTTAPDPTNMPFTVDIVFDEDVFGFEMTDLVVTNGTPSAFTGSGTTYSVLITPTASDDVIVEIPAGVTQDLATNPNDGASFTIEFDNIPPSPPQITHISDYTCSTDVSQTSDNTLEISGTSERGSTVEVFIEGISVGTTISDINTGFFTFDHTGTVLADGSYTITAQATDIAMNTGALSNPFAITINTVDSDGDGNPDFCDDDDDGDGVDDVDQDCDGDGIIDSQDTDNSACGNEILQIKTYGFSPNGDGVNETWFIENITAYPNSLVQVFNRSGKQVFKKKGYQNDWDGISNQINSSGNENRLPVGPYIFIIDLGNGTTPVRGWLYINY